MTETEKPVASDPTGGLALSAGGHGHTKGIKSHDILISAAIVLTQLVQVRVLPHPSMFSIAGRSPANIE